LNISVNKETYIDQIDDKIENMNYAKKEVETNPQSRNNYRSNTLSIDIESKRNDSIKSKSSEYLAKNGKSIDQLNVAGQYSSINNNRFDNRLN